MSQGNEIQTIGSVIGAKLCQWAGTIGAGIVGSLDASIPHFIPCAIMIALDVYTANALGRRVRRKYPQHADGKFKSRYIGRVLWTFGLVFALMLVGAHIDMNILGGGHQAVNGVVVAFVFYESISCLENWSSENDSKIARAFQRILVNKAERHLDVRLSDILLDEEKEKSEK